MKPTDPDKHTAAVPDGAGERFERLLRVMDRLRSPGGCPWDATQTHESLVRYLVEETYEVVEAVEAPVPGRGRRDGLVEELGDILLQVVFHARIGQEHGAEGGFDITDVLTAVTDKLVRRHPTVFAAPQRTGTEAGGAAEAESPGPGDDELSARWDALKRAEKPQRTGVFDGIPPALPALAYAEKALSKARRHGVEERPAPPRAAATAEPAAGAGHTDGRERAEAALGDRLFEQVRAASAVGLDPERALREAVRRYVRARDRPVADTLPGDR